MTKLLATLMVLGTAACGGKSSPTLTPGATSAVADPLATCELAMRHARTCTDAYIPALVDMRIRLDLPAGIAAQAATPDGRNALISQAQTEWTTDSTDAAIAANCQRLTAQPSPGLTQAATDLRACEAKTDCGEYATCHVAAIEALHRAGH